MRRLRRADRLPFTPATAGPCTHLGMSGCGSRQIRTLDPVMPTGSFDAPRASSTCVDEHAQQRNVEFALTDVPVEHDEDRSTHR